MTIVSSSSALIESADLTINCHAPVVTVTASSSGVDQFVVAAPDLLSSFVLDGFRVCNGAKALKDAAISLLAHYGVWPGS